MTTYIGNRYVPKIIGAWDTSKNTPYESLSIVMHNGDSYTSKTFVPISIDITNTNYWVKTSEFNVQLSSVQNSIISINQSITNLTNSVNSNSQDITSIEGQIDTINSQLNTINSLLGVGATLPSKTITKTTSAEINTEIASYVTNGYKVIFPEKEFVLNAPILIPNKAKIDFNNCTFKRQPTFIFDMVKTSGTSFSDIHIQNLYIDGNKDADSLTGASASQMFSGLALDASNSIIENITVYNTVNNEDNLGSASGVLITGSYNLLSNINAYNNVGTGIYFIGTTNNILNNSKTFNNTWSGISTNNTGFSLFNNLISYSNNASNISINGKNNIVNGVQTTNAGYSGLNIGHSESVNFSSDNTVISNVNTTSNNYEGITINNSSYVSLNNIYSNGNSKAGNTREEIRVINSSYVKINNAKLYNTIGKISNGIRVYGGIGHTLSSSEISNCNAGVYLDNNSSISLSNTVNIHDCTFGIYTTSDLNTQVIGTRFSNNTTAISLNTTTGIQIVKPVFLNNTTNITGTNVSSSLLDYYNSTYNVNYKSFGNSSLYNKKDSVANNTTTNFFTHNMDLHGRCIIDYIIYLVYPASSTQGILMALHGISVVQRLGNGTFSFNSTFTPLSTSSTIGGITANITPSFTTDTTNNTFTFTINQTNSNSVACSITIKAELSYLVGNNFTQENITLN